jgi:hypothetical protein
VKTEQNSNADLSLSVRLRDETLNITKKEWQNLLRHSETLKHLYTPKLNPLVTEKTESADIVTQPEIDLSYLSKKDWNIVTPFVGPLGRSINTLKRLDLSFRDSLSLLMSSRYLELNNDVEFAAYQQAVNQLESSEFLQEYAQSPFPITITTNANGDTPGLVPPDLSHEIAKGAFVSSQPIADALLKKPTVIDTYQTPFERGYSNDLVIMNKDGSRIMRVKKGHYNSDYQSISDGFILYHVKEGNTQPLTGQVELNGTIHAATFDNVNNTFLIVVNEDKNGSLSTRIKIFSADGRLQAQCQIKPALKNRQAITLKVTDGEHPHIIISTKQSHGAFKNLIYSHPWAVQTAPTDITLTEPKARDTANYSVFSKDHQLVVTKPSTDDNVSPILTNLITDKTTELSDFPSNWYKTVKEELDEFNMKKESIIPKFCFSLDGQQLIRFNKSKNYDKIYSLQSKQINFQTTLFDQLAEKDGTLTLYSRIKNDSVILSSQWLIAQGNRVRHHPSFKEPYITISAKSVGISPDRGAYLLSNDSRYQSINSCFSGDGKKIAFYTVIDYHHQHKIEVFDVSFLNAVSKMIHQKKFFIEHFLLISTALAKIPLEKMLAVFQKFYETLEPELQQMVRTEYQAQRTSKKNDNSFAQRFWHFVASRILRDSPIKKSDSSNPAAAKSNDDNLD